jgi:hypothetical protein
MFYLQPPSNTPEYMNIAERSYCSASVRIAGSISADGEILWLSLQISMNSLRRKQYSKLSRIHRATRLIVTPAILAVIDCRGVFDKARSMIGRVVQQSLEAVKLSKVKGA